MDGRDFLPVARELVQTATRAHRRSASGRAYYALLLESREMLFRCGFAVPPRDKVHHFIRLRLTYAIDPAVKRVGLALEVLGRLRNAADYDLQSGDFETDTKVLAAIRNASDAIVVLDALESDPVRLAAVIADIRARWP